MRPCLLSGANEYVKSKNPPLAVILDFIHSQESRTLSGLREMLADPTLCKPLRPQDQARRDDTMETMLEFRAEMDRDVLVSKEKVLEYLDKMTRYCHQKHN